IIQLCDALSYIHSEGLIHSDIKPENIIILKKTKTAKLLDFSLTGPIDLATTKMIKGTLPYIAPELVKGIRVDGRSDLYSLGVLLYEIVTGIQPFKGKEPIEVIRQHIERKPDLPTKYNTNIPKQLEKVILKLMEKEPENRYASAEELMYDVGKIVGEEIKPGRGEPRLLNPKFVGRGKELAELQSLYEETKKGKGSLVLIGGETGIGKTRLMQEYRYQVQIAGAKHITVWYPKSGDIPYKLSIDLLLELIRYLEPNNVDLIKKFGSELLRLIPDLGKKKYMEGVKPAVKLPPKAEKLRLFDSITRFLIESAYRVGPLVILMEDLHLARKDDIDLLEYLSNNIRKSKVIICGTYRSEQVIPSLKLKEAGFEEKLHPLTTLIQAKENVHLINLERLDLEHTHSFISSMLGISWIEDKIANRIFEMTAGNPLFIEAVMDSLVKEGILTRKPLYWNFDFHKLKKVTIPEKVDQVIRRKLGGLTEDVLKTLGIASIIGKEFRLDILGELKEWTDEQLYRAIKEGIKQAVLIEKRTKGRLEYDFTHPLIREMFYQEVEPWIRKSMHQKNR
ncbi:MAG TPA: hypothetical protein EYP60_04645, partial [bacterium (Candidatus Stahlbacteria)]|nr:hypothetical protein [Candidatus Stahlbacteria bacterium]